MPIIKDTRRAARLGVTWGMAAMPAAWLALSGLFVLRARLAMGRWPTPYGPDPKDLGFGFHYSTIVVGVPFMFAAVALVMVLTVLGHDRSKQRWFALIAAVAGLATVVVLGRIDPGHMFMWLAD